MKKLELDIVLLKQRYKTLSEIQEKFPRKSNHLVCKFLDAQMQEVLFEIEQKTLFPITEPKTSVIVSCVYDRPYNFPNGDVIHYYKLIFKNGDRGLCGVEKVFSYRLTVGSKLSYILKNNKIKFTLQEQ
jgi:hypothetical protein